MLTTPSWRLCLGDGSGHDTQSPRTTLTELSFTPDSACPTVSGLPNSSPGQQSLRDRRPGDLGVVLEHERRGGITPEHFQHQPRPSSAQGRAQSVVEDLDGRASRVRPRLSWLTASG